MRSGRPRRPAATVVPGLLAAVLLLLAAPAVVRAASIEASDFRERSDDPTAVTFSARVTAPAGLESVSFVYKVLNPDGNVGGSGDATFAPGAETDVTFTLRTLTFERYIPVGSTFVYHWELADREGATLAAEGVGVATTVITIGVAVGSGVGVAPSNVMPQAEARARRIDRKAMFDATRAAGLGDPRWGHDA